MTNVYARLVAYVILGGLAGFGIGTYSAETGTFTFSISVGELSLLLVGAPAVVGLIFKRWGTK